VGEPGRLELADEGSGADGGTLDSRFGLGAVEGECFGDSEGGGPGAPRGDPSLDPLSAGSCMVPGLMHGLEGIKGLDLAKGNRIQ
jgi:hypothetical protein